MPEMIGRLQSALADRYRLERELGGGGMSRVYLATERALGRAVVIKVVAPELLAGLSAERFAREVRLAARLQQANVVPLLHAGDADGMPYYTMPYVEGLSLRARLEQGAVSPGEAIHILRDVARALAYAHSQGVVHRDIKPENVLLSGGAAMVTDFGIAKALTVSRTTDEGSRAITLTQAGGSPGTPAYMAPEQAAGDAVDQRTDLYAWGVVAYELLTGKHPFAGRNTAHQIIAAHLGETPAPLETRARGIPAPLATMVMKCLAKNPTDRPATAGELLAALDQGGPVSRSWGRTAGIGALGVAALAIAGYVILRPSRTDVLLEPKRVVVATFENKSGDPSLDPLGAMASDWIARGLVGTGLVDVGGTAADLAARGVTTAGGGQAALQSLARNANAGLVISGAYYRQGDSVLFQADFTDANARKLIQTVGPVAARSAAPLDGVERLKQQVIGSLGPLVDERLASLGPELSRPPSLEAYREFLAGQDLFYKDEAAAVVHFTRAAATDSNYQIPLLWAIVVSQNDGRLNDSLVRLAESRRHRMTPYEQVYLDYAECRSAPGLATCVPSTAALLRLTPKSQFVKYLRGITLRWVNRPRAADSAFRTLDPLSGELRGRIYFPIYHAGVLHALGEYQRELAVTQSAQAQYPGRLFLYHTMARALIANGRLEDANRLLDEAFGIGADMRSSPYRTATLTMYELRWHGHSATADSLGARLLKRLASRPAGEAENRQGQLDRADVLMATHRWGDLLALTDSMATGDSDNIETLRFRGVALAMTGKRNDALAIEQLLARDNRPARPVDRCNFWAVCRRAARAYIAAALGDSARAVSLIDGWVFRSDFEAHFDQLGEWLREYGPFQDLARPGG